MHVDDTFGKDDLARFEKMLDKQKLTAVSINKFDRVKPDLDDLVNVLFKSDPQAVVIV